MPKITYRVHDPELDHTFDTKHAHEVHNYAMDNYLTDSPVHVETLHDGKSVKMETIDPKQYAGHTGMGDYVRHLTGKSFAFRKN